MTQERDMWIEVDERSGVPIYVQIVDRVRHAVEVGGLRSGDKLPTVRALAEELEIAPNTIVKAYGELRREGILESRPGVGTVVVEGIEEISRERSIEALHGRIRELVRDAASLGVSQDELWERLDAEFERVRL